MVTSAFFHAQANWLTVLVYSPKPLASSRRKIDEEVINLTHINMFQAKENPSLRLGKHRRAIMSKTKTARRLFLAVMIEFSSVR
jgi:hypothetical protein